MPIVSCRLCDDTEDYFTEAFWASLDLVANALDNISGRLYVDGKCVRHCKPLVDSGTLGTKANVQVIYPHVTESYGASRDPVSKQIPMCTMKYYPFAIEHTLQWARSTFEHHFSELPQIAKTFQESDVVEVKEEDMVNLREFFLPVPGPCNVAADCVAWARYLWEHYFVFDIKQLLHHFPPDAKNNDGTQPFWSPPKRCPKPLAFDSEDGDVAAFVRAASILKGVTMGIDVNPKGVAGIARNITVPEFRPNSDAKIPTTDEESKELEKTADDPDDLEDALNIIRSLDTASINVNVVEFEKDDDTNHHMDFVHAASNLRARCYDIPTTDKSKAKLIAGKIIPALATTTSVVAGLASIELLKASWKVEEGGNSFKNSFVNLSLPLIAFSSPVPPESFSGLGRRFTQWDFISVEGGHTRTIGQIIDLLRERENIPEVFMMTYGPTLIYAGFMQHDKVTARLAQTCPEALASIRGRGLPEHVKTMEIAVAAEDEEGNDIDLPEIRLKLAE